MRTREESVARRAGQDAADKAAYLALVRQERKLDRERRAEERKLEAAAEIITRTVGRAGKGRSRTVKRAEKMLETLSDAGASTPTRTTRKSRSEATRPRNHKTPRSFTRRK
jgi:hypothetical protein